MASSVTTANQIGQRLPEAIKKSGLNVPRVAKRAYILPQFIYDIIAGKSRNPSPKKLARIAEVLGVRLAWLVGVPENRAASMRHVEEDNAEIPYIGIDSSAPMLSSIHHRWVEASGVAPAEGVLAEEELLGGFCLFILITKSNPVIKLVKEALNVVKPFFMRRRRSAYMIRRIKVPPSMAIFTKFAVVISHAAESSASREHRMILTRSATKIIRRNKTLKTDKSAH